MYTYIYASMLLVKVSPAMWNGIEVCIFVIVAIGSLKSVAEWLRFDRLIEPQLEYENAQ